MPLVSWYLHKANQCSRLAKHATDPRKRAGYKEEQKLWLDEKTKQAELEEGSQFGKDPD
jgi:hypothetical protein